MNQISLHFGNIERIWNRKHSDWIEMVHFHVQINKKKQIAKN